MAGSANIAFGVDLTGDKELMRKLDGLSGNIGRKVLRKAMRAGSTPIKAEAKANVPVGDTENLKDSLGVRMRWYNVTGTMVAVIGPRIRKETTSKRTGKVTEALKGQHGYITEFGTAPRYTKAGAYRGIGPAQPFMRPAWDKMRKRAEILAVNKLLEEVEKEAKRGG